MLVQVPADDHRRNTHILEIGEELSSTRIKRVLQPLFPLGHQKVMKESVDNFPVFGDADGAHAGFNSWMRRLEPIFIARHDDAVVLGHRQIDVVDRLSTIAESTIPVEESNSWLSNIYKRS